MVETKTKGPEFWRSLNELQSDPEFEELLHREFPEHAAELPEGVDRRRFLQLMSASFALAGLAGCTRQPPEKIIPYVEQPESLVPGQPMYFASGYELDGYATGILVESHMGRPTKIEGNPEHPASLGASGAFAQASLLSLCDPDRSRAVRHLNRIRTWSAFVDDTKRGLGALAALGGARLRILTGPLTSPSLAAQIRQVLAEYPKARWHQYSPVGRGNVGAGSAAAFGRPLAVRYELQAARVVVDLDADFLNSGPGAIRYARDFMAGRKVRQATDTMNRLYVAETSPTGTGVAADHRLPVPAAALGRAVVALAHKIGVPGVPAVDVEATLKPWIEAAAADLSAHRGQGTVIAGDYCSPEVHVVAHAINEHLGNAGETVIYSEPVEAEPSDPWQDLAALTEDMAAGEVDVLLTIGVNPVFDAPANLDFATAMASVSRRIHLGAQDDETGERCHWHVPLAHQLESWGDARAFDGTVTLRQPLIEPLHGGKTATEVLATLTEAGERPYRELLEEFWQAELGEAGFEAAWRKAVHDGFFADSGLPAVAATIQPAAVQQAAAEITEEAAAGLTIVFRPDPTIYDGRFANNGWLQECPKPLTKLTWDNAAIIGPALANRHGLANEQIVNLEIDGRSLELPVWIQPGQADETITLHLGYGRTQAGNVGNGTGFNVYTLRSGATPWQATGASLTPTAKSYPLVSTQMHHNIALEGREAEQRHLVRTASLEEFQHHPEFAQHVAHGTGENLSLYPDFEYNGYAWGLSIDLGSCTGCNACVLACQSENHVPIVGKDEVQAGREMHWIRIDRYFEGDLDDPHMHHQPVMCMHCEQAPCEVVCPVAATTHSDEGLNEMTYNRCVGTRYCSNNCPYKVRRFNFFKYADFDDPITKLLRNPDVTVRSRGVMEKCSYCVQRINQARIQAGREDRQIQDGEVVTACQQACPTEAIVFGDLNDTESRVAKRKNSPLDYGILEELSTRPRTTYMARVKNTNPSLHEKPEKV